MSELIGQQEWFEGCAPAQRWDEEAVKRSLDELFNFAHTYKASKSYWELIQFIGRFHFYAPYNALLVYLQMPGAKFVAPANRWKRPYGREIKPNARHLVILQPMGPVMIVFDVSDTVPGPNAMQLPPEVEGPYKPRKGKVNQEFERTIENAKRDGIRIQLRKEGSQSAGSIREEDRQGLWCLQFQTGKDTQGNLTHVDIPVRYNLLMNENLSRTAQYATLVHELAHLHCGHLGTPNDKWWPDRRGLSREVQEFEAESVTYLICCRLGIDNPSEEHLAGYVENNKEVPSISLECIMKSAGIIEQMGMKRLKPRKEKEE